MRPSRAADAARLLAFALALFAHAPATAQTFVAAYGMSAGGQELTFEDRVRAQAAIERVYQRHRTAGAGALDVTLPRSVLEGRVRTHIGKSAALEETWGTRITTGMLQDETERMLRTSAMPERLEELFSALGDNPHLIRECLARPILADRLARGFFARDESIHGDTRAAAEVLRRRLVEGEIDSAIDHPDRSEVRFTLGNRAKDSLRPDALRGRVRALDRADYDAVREMLPAVPGEIGPVLDLGEAFEIRVVLGETEDEVTVAAYQVPKITWDTWWESVRAGFETQSIGAGRAAALPLPPPRQVESEVGGSPCYPDDQWINGSMDDVPLPRYGHTAVWTGSEMIVWGAQYGGGRYNPSTDAWTALSLEGSPPVLFGQTAVWSGSEMIVWGGFGNSVGLQQTGARYDPATDRWTPTAVLGAPTARWRHRAAWTGSEMLVWGGRDDGPDSVYTNTGGLYDPTADSWRTMSTIGAPSPRLLEAVVWTGSEFVVWGGVDAVFGGRVNTGGRYDLASDTWEAISTMGAPSPRENHTAVWTGQEILVWGGYDGFSNYMDGGRYDPAADTWAPVSDLDRGYSRHAAIWTGDAMLVWGSGQGGERYDPETDEWVPLSTMNAPESFRFEFSTVWTGSLMIVWGGWTNVDPFRTTDSGGRYDPAIDAWAPMAADTPVPREDHTAVWTGSEMIVWGGGTSRFFPTAVNAPGGRYDPATDSWSLISTIGAPAARFLHTAVWSGSEMIVWGGFSSEDLDTGGRYDPASDSWRPTTLIGAPSPRIYHTALWTGTEMIVWGGLRLNQALYSTGGRYNPATDTWLSTPIAGAPEERFHHAAVWNGQEMIVWGGAGLEGRLDTGGRFDPESGNWMPTSTESAPAPRREHSATWTGTEMIVWGGSGDGGYVNTGGRYTPATDTWSATSLDEAPYARRDHTAVWTGRELLIWGDLVLFPGKRYRPATDTWSDMSQVGSPLPRQRHTAVWAEPLMIIWGGRCCGGYGLNGGRYSLDTSPDQDGDDWTTCGGDCDDETPTVSPDAIETCDGVDQDCNGIVDDTGVDADGDGYDECVDCDDGDAAVGAVPPEVTGARFGPDGVTLFWDPVTAFPSGTPVYDVLRGDLEQLPVGAGVSEDCLGHEIADNALAVVQAPPSMKGFWYLIRAKADCSGTFGESSAGAARTSTSCDGARGVEPGHRRWDF